MDVGPAVAAFQVVNGLGGFGGRDVAAGRAGPRCTGVVAVAPADAGTGAAAGQLVEVGVGGLEEGAANHDGGGKRERDHYELVE